MRRRAGVKGPGGEGQEAEGAAVTGGRNARGGDRQEVRGAVPSAARGRTRLRAPAGPYSWLLSRCVSSYFAAIAFHSFEACSFAFVA